MFVKGILPIYQHLHVEDSIVLEKTGLYYIIEETHVTAKRIPSKIET
jgi:hypothetical protein